MIDKPRTSSSLCKLRFGTAKAEAGMELRCCVQAGWVVSQAYERLAKLSIFVKAAYNGERTHNEQHQQHFADEFSLLEDEIYRLMCALSMNVYLPLIECRRNVPILGRHRVRAIRRTRAPEPSTNAERHVRDYVAVHRLLDVTRRLVADVQQMRSDYHN